ncbi:small ribosomal subunit protein mS23 [Pogona vitticeps]|uniref:Small ribosomal subunit protein mS23 n=1 Tax=Pogona vitticeps TaxID=103695 RepID=A0A6J0T1W1_9SAUR|nr:28S ribosomal protein S23, mitochondrial [Pogona vitticeps]
MAGSRLEKLSSIFFRTRGLLRSGVMPEAKKPVWYEVYAAFPPLREPVYQDPNPETDKEEDPIRPILYPEDKIRAKFYQVYGNGPKAFQLSKLNFESACQKFVQKYNLLEQKGEVDEDRLFEETGKALLAEGFLLQKHVAPLPSQEAKQEHPALSVKIHNVLSEAQSQPQEQAPEPAEDVPKGGPLPSS